MTLDDSTCPLCGAPVTAEPKCAKCKWPLSAETTVDCDDVTLLAEFGVEFDTDTSGEVTRVRLSGEDYNDRTVEKLAELCVALLDVRDTKITAVGVARLQMLLPMTQILH